MATEQRNDGERKGIDFMSDREIAEETLTLLRLFADTLTALNNHPMAAMMMPPNVRAMIG
jgi:hypothetical protein